MLVGRAVTCIHLFHMARLKHQTATCRDDLHSVFDYRVGHVQITKFHVDLLHAMLSLTSQLTDITCSHAHAQDKLH